MMLVAMEGRARVEALQDELVQEPVLLEDVLQVLQEDEQDEVTEERRRLVHDFCLVSRL